MNTNTTKTHINAGMDVRVKGRKGTYTIESIKSGWATLTDGTKARVGTLTPVEQEKRVKLEPKLENYVITKEVRTITGRVSIDNDDAIARRLRGMHLDDLYPYAAQIMHIPEQQLRDRYQHLNAGMQRMNLGNKLRAWIKVAEADGPVAEATEQKASKSKSKSKTTA